MIYILGMSHIEPILNGCSVNGIEEQLGKLAHDREPAFVDWDTLPGSLPGKVKAASIYIGRVHRHWGHVLAEFTAPGVIGIHPGYRRLLDSIDMSGQRPTLFVCLHGEEYHHMCIHPYNAPPDFELPARPDLAIVPGRQVVPLEVVEQAAQFFLKKAIANLYALRTYYPQLRIVNVICPPPSDAGDVDAPATHYVRLKNYLVYENALREAAKSAGIESLSPPAQALSELGTLKKEYAGDQVHGNKQYGELVLAQMRNLLAQGAQ